MPTSRVPGRLALLSAIAALLASLFVVGVAEATLADSDRSTPRRAMGTFLLAAEANDYVTAAALLDLRSLPGDLRETRGPELARQLHYVLERNVWVEPDLLSDDPHGTGAAGTERVGSVRMGGADVPITLARSEHPPHEWAISAMTVARIPRLYEANGPGWLESRVPRAFHVRAWGLAGWQWLGLLAGIIGAYVIGRALTSVAVWIAKRVTSRTSVKWDDELLNAVRHPSRFLCAVIALRLLLDHLSLSAAAAHVISRLLGIVFIFALAWIAHGVVGVVSAVVERRAQTMAEATEGDQRGLKTQVRVLRRVVNAAIGIIALAAMLTQFELVRTVGVSLLASAGVAGVVLGFAAQRTFGSLVAGIQLSFTQPIRIGDVVIVEKEWGTIEEVTLTFVVVRTWDERRLIVPMTRFLEQPFENWTKGSPELHGTVFLHVDWRLPIDDVRKELDRIVEGNKLWDGRTKSVAVTATTDRTIEVRALVSAADSSALWNLRIEVRERLVAWLQQHEGGRFLPQLRVIETRASESTTSR